MNNAIKNERTLECVAIHEGTYGTAAQIKQTMTSTYPAKRASNSLSNNLFSDDEFGEGQTFTSVRHTLIKVPDGTTEEQVQERLNKTNACIYTIISNDVKDVMTSEQLEMIRSGQSDLTVDDYKVRYLNRNSEGDVYSGNEVIGKINDDDEFEVAEGHENTPREYIRRVFNSTVVEDKDLRSKENAGTPNAAEEIDAAIESAVEMDATAMASKS